MFICRIEQGSDSKFKVENRQIQNECHAFFAFSYSSDISRSKWRVLSTKTIFKALLQAQLFFYPAFPLNIQHLIFSFLLFVFWFLMCTPLPEGMKPVSQAQRSYWNENFISECFIYIFPSFAKKKIAERKRASD